MDTGVLAQLLLSIERTISNRGESCVRNGDGNDGRLHAPFTKLAADSRFVTRSIQ